MNWSEKRTELLNDYQEVNNHALRRLKKFAKFCTKHKVKGKKHPVNYVSSRGNDYYIILIRYPNTKFEWAYSMFNHHQTESDKGKMFVRLPAQSSNAYGEDGERMVTFYTPHFLQRYKERMLMDDDSTPFEVMSKFDVKNSVLGIGIGGEDKIGDGLYETETQSNDGMSLGIYNLTGGVLILNTFLSLDLLKGEQPDNFIKAEDLTKW